MGFYEPSTPPVEKVGLDRIEDAKLRTKLQLISHVLPVITGSKLLWIDDHPEKVIDERRLLRALGVTIIPAISSDQAREILRADLDFDLIVSDVQRSGGTHKITGGVDIHEGVNFIVWLRTKFADEFKDKGDEFDDEYIKQIDKYIKQIPVIFYAAYDWPRLVEFTGPARATLPEPAISNSAADFVPKVLWALAESQTAIRVPPKKGPSRIKHQ